MTQEIVKLSIPFESLVDAVAKLSLKEKHQLWELLDEQMAQAEAETLEKGSTVQAEVQEVRATYQAEEYGNIDEHIGQLKHRIAFLLDALPETKLAVVFDFVQFLAEHELQIAWMNAQSQSAAYQEWAGSDNDIYDEVFTDVYPAR